MLTSSWFHLSILADKSHSKVWHGPEDGDEWLDGVAVHDRPVLLEVLRCKPALVNDPEKSLFLHLTL